MIVAAVQRSRAAITDVARRNEGAFTTVSSFRWAEPFLPRGRFPVAMGEEEMMDSLSVSGSLRRTVLAALLVAISSGPLLAQTKPKVLEHGVAQPSSVIYIGNSFFYFNNGISGHVSQFLAAAGEKPVRSSLVTISGSGLDWHDVESYFRPNAVGRYTIDTNNVVSFNKPERLFDIAIMMDCSQCPVHPDLKSPFEEYAKRHADTVRKHGAKPVFFMSWAYLDKPEMTEQLAQAYTRVGNENEALVIPAGLAFARAVAKRPEVNLYMPDKRHPTLAGTYLAAATVYGSIFRKPPVGLTYTAGLDPDAARFLQSVAWDTVQEFYGLTPTSMQQRVN
jgi:hypothetical protein